MAKKTNNKAQQPTVIFSGGKWVSSDGLCFNTAAKAWNHIRDIEKNKQVVEDTAKADNPQPITK